MNEDEIIKKIKKTQRKAILDLITCLGDLSLTPDDLENKLEEEGKISFSKAHDSKNK
jgi:hypothetical protein